MESLNEGEMIPRADTGLVISPVVGLCSHLAAVISVSCLILTPWMIWGRHTRLRNQRLELHFKHIIYVKMWIKMQVKNTKRIQRISSVRQRKKAPKGGWNISHISAQGKREWDGDWDVAAPCGGTWPSQSIPCYKIDPRTKQIFQLISVTHN